MVSSCSYECLCMSGFDDVVISALSRCGRLTTCMWLVYSECILPFVFWDIWLQNIDLHSTTEGLGIWGFWLIETNMSCNFLLRKTQAGYILFSMHLKSGYTLIAALDGCVFINYESSLWHALHPLSILTQKLWSMERGPPPPAFFFGVSTIPSSKPLSIEQNLHEKTILTFSYMY